MPTFLVNPFDEKLTPQRQPAKRLETLEGKTIGLLDISKPGGSVFLDRIEELLRRDHGVEQLYRLTKLTFARRATDELLNCVMAEPCDAVIEALAD